MKAQRRPGAKASAESAETTETSIHARSEGGKVYGKSTERLRKDSLSSLSSLSSLPAALQALPASPCPAPAPCLVRARGRKPREEMPAAAPTTHCAAWPADGSPPLALAGRFVAHRYGRTRHWCVTHGADLVAVVLYKRGAEEVACRLNTGAAAPGLHGTDESRCPAPRRMP